LRSALGEQNAGYQQQANGENAYSNCSEHYRPPTDTGAEPAE
jgi:hypothetical protein